MQSYYDLLNVAPTASVDEIQRAFRRVIALYHPDKVLHLAPEFQDIAAAKTAELTQAYKTLTDASLRTEYDAQLTSGAAVATGAQPASSPPPPGPPPTPAQTVNRPVAEHTSPPESAPSPERVSVFAEDRAGASDLVRRAAVMRFREAVDQEFGRCAETLVTGFDVACAPPKARFWSRSVPPRMLGRFVAQVDAAAVKEAWVMASRAKKDDPRDLCVFLMGPAVAPAGELGKAIAEQRRRPLPAGGRLVMIPVNTRTWSAHVPNDAPPSVTALLTRLHAG